MIDHYFQLEKKMKKRGDMFEKKDINPLFKRL
jgi:hypothetical protein